MNKVIVIGIAALLLGLVVSMPVSVSALENTVENGNVVEGE
jgi:ABC-type phosphate/phosphonate transport system permease subunit